MNKERKIVAFFKKIPNIYTKWSISTQLILTISLIFLSFFLLQTVLNNTFFKSYYTETEFNVIHENLIDFVDDMNQADTEDYYNILYDFTTENNAYSVIVNGRHQVLPSTYTDYTITIHDTVSDSDFTFLVPNNDYDYAIDEALSATLFEYNEDYYSPAVISNTNRTVFDSNVNCGEEVCVSIEGTITNINKPSNLNYLFDENLMVQREVSKLYNDTINLEEYEYDTGTVEGSWYKSTDGPVDTLVFVHDLGWNEIVTVVPIVDTNDIISIVSQYNLYLYATAIVVIIIWSFRLSTIISKPIQNIELVTREIAQLNFNVEAHEYNNKENESLSNSINLISRNLKETLETVNTKNSELTNLYVEQSNQVSLKKQLVSSISHELKTPLMIMQVTIQGILDGIIEAGEEEKELNNVLDEINKSSFMIQDMLQIYRLDDANTKLEISEFNLSKTVCFFINDFENAIKKYEFEMDINVQDDVYVEADLKLIKRVISNYLTNAIKYTPIGGKIYAEVSETKEEVYFELTNQGATINEEDIEKIWLPFYRLEQIESKQLKTKGSGIGLYLVSEILKAHEADFGIVNVKDGVKAYFRMKKRIE